MAAGATYEKIATTTLGSTQSSVTFSSISGSYTDLVLIVSGTATGSDYTVVLQFNGDTGSNYSSWVMNGSSNTSSSNKETNGTSVYGGSIHTSQSTSITNIQNYSNTTTYKTLLARGNAAAERVRAYQGMWRNTNAIDSIKFETNGSSFASGTIFSIYGIKAA